MNTDFLNFLKAMAMCVLLSLTVALVLTGITVLHDKHTCDATGGAFYMTKTVEGCRY